MPRSSFSSHKYEKLHSSRSALEPFTEEGCAYETQPEQEQRGGFGYGLVRGRLDVDRICTSLIGNRILLNGPDVHRVSAGWLGPWS